MNKKELESIIKKIYLDGQVQQVKWQVANGNLVVNFTPNGTESNPGLTGYLESNIELEDGEIGFFDVKKFLSLVKPLDDDIKISIQYERNKPVMLSMQDANMTVNVLLADLRVIPESRTHMVINNQPQYDVQINLSNEFIQRFIKSKSALGADVVGVIPIDNEVEFILNFSDVQSDTIKIPVNAFVSNEFEPVTFDANLIFTVFSNNLDFRHARMSIMEKLMFIEFESEDVITKYFIKPFNKQS